MDWGLWLQCVGIIALAVGVVVGLAAGVIMLFEHDKPWWAVLLIVVCIALGVGSMMYADIRSKGHTTLEEVR